MKKSQNIMKMIAARNLSFTGDISVVFTKLTKFPVDIIREGGDKSCFFFFCTSRDHMTNESLDSVGEIASP